MSEHDNHPHQMAAYTSRRDRRDSLYVFLHARREILRASGHNEDRIVDFAPANTAVSIVFDPPRRQMRSVERGRQRIRLYAFQRPDGSFAIGTREEVEAAVREDLLSLRPQPFTWAEAARFIRDKEQIARAEAETSRLLQHPSWRKQKSPSSPPAVPRPSNARPPRRCGWMKKITSKSRY